MCEWCGNDEADDVLPPLTPAELSLGQAWVSRVTQADSPDVPVVGADQSPPPSVEQRQEYVKFLRYHASRVRGTFLREHAETFDAIASLLEQEQTQEETVEPYQLLAAVQDSYAGATERLHERLHEMRLRAELAESHLARAEEENAKLRDEVAANGGIYFALKRQIQEVLPETSVCSTLAHALRALIADRADRLARAEEALQELASPTRFFDFASTAEKEVSARIAFAEKALSSLRPEEQKT